MAKTAKNDITGDTLITKYTTYEYENGYELIFGNKKHLYSTHAHLSPTSVEEWEEERIDIIGQNGNDGGHYE